MRLSDKAKTALDAVIQKFRTGDLSPVVEVATLKRTTPVPFDRWSFNNRLMAYIQSGGSTDLRGYRQWQQVDRQVRKGEKAAWILAPLTKMVEDEDGEKHPVLVGFKSVPVFAYHQTEGKPLPDYDLEPVELPPLIDVARQFNISVRYEHLIGPALGEVDTQGREIRLRSQDEAVFFHELGHAIHARLNGELKGGQHEDQETVAELISCVLMWLYGLGDRTGNAWNYVQKYAKDPLMAIMKAMGTVEQVLEVLEGSAI